MMETKNQTNNNKDPYIFKSNGHYLGFIKNGFLFNPNGIYLGWLDGKFIWDKKGFFRGILINLEGKNYILLEKFSMLPPSRSPKIVENIVPLVPQPSIKRISLPVDMIDGFE